jgi:hypothetical protein
MCKKVLLFAQDDNADLYEIGPYGMTRLISTR